MNRSVTLFTGQWADIPFETVCQKAKSFGYDGLELACWGDHFEVDKADDAYCENKRKILDLYGLTVHAISNHLVGQAVTDRIDQRHKSILPAYVWGDGEPEGVRQRAAQEMIRTAEAAKRLGVNIVNGFTGSPIWHLIYSFPPVTQAMVDEGYSDFATRWIPILDHYQKLGIRFALEVHPTEIAFDIASTRRTLEAIDHHSAFGFNFDPSHLGYQGVDYIGFLYAFAKKIFHVHMKDVAWSKVPTEAGVFGGHTEFGTLGRNWDFRSLGHGDINFEEIIRALNRIGYKGPLSVEWEDGGMDREHGAKEACEFVRRIDFPSSNIAFDAAFEK
ncbi:sugar phosphate isomerase/epimerase [Flavobacterium cellulosilyticum]|uniref:Sugar phosphate isomerase/epimerase n=2 Tax=Flavobacterium cellulosilyticum TaxID=2541731 RepID=A0A4V2YYW1_9FLAO|nr:sugar phosphate isomerase/epimerase [Flavobacterium cellulosilyticum]